MKTMLILFLAAFPYLVTGATGQIGANFHDDPPVYSWRVEIKFDLPSLDPQAIQICLLDFDPRERFISKFNTTYLNDRLSKAKDEKEKEMQIRVSTEVNWNFLFRAINGSELYLLTPDTMVLSQSANYPTPKATKWLTSKVFYIDKKPYCYAIPFEVENGSDYKVVLNSANLTSLSELYGKVKK